MRYRAEVISRISVFVVGVLLQTPAPAPAPTVLPASTLPIALVGVAVDDATPANSVAMIRCAGPSVSAPEIFKVGQRACDVAELTQVRQDAVVIRNLLNGKVETLSFHKTAAAPGAPPAPPAAVPTPSVVRRSATAVTVDVPKAAVDHYLLNLTDLLTSALATPHFREGGGVQPVMDGFQLGQITPGSVIEKLGLKNGDVITEVNGEKLDSLATVMRLAGQVQNMGQAKMLVLRAGKPLTFVFNTK